MTQWAMLVTDWPAGHTDEFLQGLKSGQLHPMEAKKRLAQRIVELYHGRPAAIAAREEFEHTFQEGGRPNELPETALSGPTRLLDVLLSVNAAPSRSAARRLIEGGAVSLDDKRATSLDEVVACSTTMRVGPRRFYRIIVA